MILLVTKTVLIKPLIGYKSQSSHPKYQSLPHYYFMMPYIFVVVKNIHVP